MVTRRMLKGQPAGVFLVAATEMWERFSYYGITALLVLYLTAPLSESGFGWESADAIRLYGLYAGLAFAAPAIGGWISSSLLGERRCIALGGAAIMLGHLLLGGPAYLPPLIGAVSDVPVEQILLASGVEQGHLTIDASTEAGLAAAVLSVTGHAGGVLAARWAYALQSWSFMGGLAFVIIGTALLKPTISSILGKLYAADDPRRSFGFTLFMVGVWSGSFFANFVAGTLGERLGWHYGFMAAAIGMAAGLTVYLLNARRLLGDAGRAPDHPGSMRAWLAAFPRLGAQERRNLGVLAMLSAFTIVYAVAFYQKGGLIHLLVRDDVARTVGGFEIPAAWFLSISTGSFIVLAPCIAMLFARFGRFPDTAACVALGLASLACGYVVLVAAVTVGAANGAPISMSWFVVAYVFFGLGDVFIWPPQLATVTALAPRAMTSFIVGLWYVTVGVGNYAAGLVGAWSHGQDTAYAFTALLMLLVVAVVVAVALRPWMLARAQLANKELAPAPMTRVEEAKLA